MPTCVVGAQWGDEGKGKVAHYLAGSFDAVARYGGGDNAGHTVVVDGRQYKLHLVPSGIFYPQVICILGTGMVINPKVLLEELETLEKFNISTENLFISNGAHVVMPYHYWQDEKEESQRGEGKIGTTGRGIGPAYQDKVARQGIRMVDLTDLPTLREKLVQNLTNKAFCLQGDFDLLLDKLLNEYVEYGKILAGRIVDVSSFINKLICDKKKILFEGAQGTLLDLDFGTYPFVTASHPVAGGASVGLGVAPYHITSVIGILKAYTTRVGNGVFPTELVGKEDEMLREKGNEYGTTTGRPRRCGWLDMVMLRYGARINGYTTLAITKLDVLSNISPLKICTAYKLRDKVVYDLPPLYHQLEQCQPVYEELNGWEEDIRRIRDYNKLPLAARHYLKRISQLLDARISLISVGSKPEETIIPSHTSADFFVD